MQCRFAPGLGRAAVVLTIAWAWSGTALAQQSGAPPVFGADFAPVPYEDVLENPDDVDINLRYARTQISEGRLDGAAITLERILILNPELNRVRLLYAIVLYRLDNLAEAKQEFEALKATDELPSKLAAEAQSYLDAIAQRRKTWNGAVTFGAGIHVDSNRNSYPESDRFRIQDQIIPGTQDQNGDVGVLGFANLELGYDPGMQRVSSIYVDMTGLMDQQAREDDLDLFAGMIETGAHIDASAFQVVPHMRYENLGLAGNRYADIVEGGVRINRVSHAISGLKSFLGGRISYEDFKDTPNVPFNHERSGPLFEAEAGVRYDVTPAFQVEGSYTLSIKDANESFQSYEGHELALSGTYVFGNQSFLVGTGSLDRQTYDAPDTFINPSATITRQDTDSRLRLTYGVPFNVLLKTAGVSDIAPETRSLVLSVSGEYFESESNIRNFEYENWRSSFLITKRFAF